MYKDFSKPDEVRIVNTLKHSLVDFRDGFLSHKESFTIVAFLFTITGLFLNIDSTDIFIKRIQALFLLINTLVIVWLIYSSSKHYIRGKYSELYHSFAITILWVACILIYNLFGYLFVNFKQELLFYLKWIGTPLIGLALNILSIYFFRLLKQYKEITDYSQFENFFLVTLDMHIGMA